MFNNSLLSDVKFVTTGCHNSTTEIPAHRFGLLLRVEEHRTRHQNGMGKRETLSLIYDKCMQPGSLNSDKLMH